MYPILALIFTLIIALMIHAQILLSRDADTSGGFVVQSNQASSLYYECRGQRTNDTLIFLEGGLAASSAMWDRYMPLFAEYTQVCRYDRPGMGRSEPVPDVTLGACVQNIHTVIKDIERRDIDEGRAPATRVIFVGHSRGDPTVRYYQNEYLASTPEVAGLILIEGSTWPNDASVEPTDAPVTRDATPRWLTAIRPLLTTLARSGILRPLPDGILGPVGQLLVGSSLSQSQVAAYSGSHGLDTVFQEYAGYAQFNHDFNNTKSGHESETGTPLPIKKVKHASGESLPHLAFLSTDRLDKRDWGYIGTADTNQSLTAEELVEQLAAVTPDYAEALATDKGLMRSYSFFQTLQEVGVDGLTWVVHTKSCGQEIVKIDARHNDFLTDPSVVAKCRPYIAGFLTNFFPAAPAN